MLRTGVMLAVVCSMAACLPAQAAEVTVGASGPLSGPLAYFGSTYANGIDLAFREFNRAGGLNGATVKLRLIDDKADPREGTTAAQKHCDDESEIVVIAHVNAGVTIPSRTIYAECGLPQITVSSASKVTADGFTNLFRPVPRERDFVGVSVNYAYDVLNARTAASVSDKQAFGQAYAEFFRDLFTARGGKITSLSGVNPQDVDFTSLIGKLKTEKPDAVFFGGVMPQVALFRRQMIEQGLNVPLLTGDSAFLPAFIDQAGEANAAGTFIAYAWPPAEGRPNLQAFNERYRKEFGVDAGALSALGYTAGQVVIAAMKSAAKLDRPSMIAALRGLKYDSFTGPIEFNAAGDIKAPQVFVYKVVGRNFVVDYPK